MYMWKVESVATEENTTYEPAKQILAGMGNNSGFELYTDYESARDRAREIDESCERFFKLGHKRKFFGHLSYVYVPVDEMVGLYHEYGHDEYNAAIEFVLGD